MGGLGSSRWGSYRKRYTVEECQLIDCRVTASQAEMVSRIVPVVTTPQHFGEKRYWATCPVCGRRVMHLYIPPGQERMACRNCWNLTYESCQTSGQVENLARLVQRHLNLPQDETLSMIRFEKWIHKEHRFQARKQRLALRKPKWQK